MRAFLETDAAIKQVIFVDDAIDNPVNMYIEFVKLDSYFESMKRTVEVHSYWYQPAVAEEILDESNVTNFEKYRKISNGEIVYRKDAVPCDKLKGEARDEVCNASCEFTSVQRARKLA